MKRQHVLVLMTALACGANVPGLLAQGVQPHPDLAHTVVWYPKVKIFAQQLCEEITKKHQSEGVQFAVIHGNVQDTTKLGVVLASSEGLDKGSRPKNATYAKFPDQDITWKESIEIGLPDTEISTLVSGPAECIIFHPHVNQERCAVRLPIIDSSGRTIRAGFSVSFTPYKYGDDPLPYIKRAIEMRDELRPQIPDLDALYKPATN